MPILKNGNEAEILRLIAVTEKRCPYCAAGLPYSHDDEVHLITALTGTILHRKCKAKKQRYRLAELFVEPAK